MASDDIDAIVRELDGSDLQPDKAAAVPASESAEDASVGAKKKARKKKKGTVLEVLIREANEQ